MGFTQVVTTTSAGSTTSVVTTPISYSLDANGALTSDGLRSFDYDASNRLAKVRLMKDGEAASINCLTNGLGQRVFKSEIQIEQTLPDEETLGPDFISWLKSNFRWLFARQQASTSIGKAFTYADGALPEWVLLGEYDNGSASGDGRSEYIWLPTGDGAMPVGMYRNGQLYAIHADHLGTPRLMTDSANKPVWQWPYSGFGANRPTGPLQVTADPNAAVTTDPMLLKPSHATTLNLRFPGQYNDSETGSFYNYFRTYDAKGGRYTQPDPIGLEGGLNRFAYSDVNPVGITDAEGLNPAAVYRAAVTGYRVGEALNPVLQPLIASTVNALLLPGFDDPNALMAQNNKQIRRRIQGLQDQIDEHKRKLQKEPDCPPANHWENEIKVWQAEIDRLKLRLPNGK